MGPGDSDRRARCEPEVTGLRAEVAGLVQHGTSTGRLPASGRPHDEITLQRNQDYPGDSDLCFGIGNSETRVRLTAGDQEKVRAVLSVPRPDGQALSSPAELRQLARETGLSGQGHGTGLARAIERLVDRAYIAGQADFSAGSGRGAARDYLLGEAEHREGDPGGMAHQDVEALNRVIAMLES